MKKFSIIILTMLFLLVGCSNEQKNNSITVDGKQSVVRVEKNIGVCEKQKQNVYVYVQFLDDNESSWNQTSIDHFMNKELISGLNYLADKANDYDVEFTYETSYISASTSETGSMKYNGNVQGFSDENGVEKPIYEECAKLLGYTSENDFYQNMQEEVQNDQIVHLIALNKEGRSYAHTFRDVNIYAGELCVVFNQYYDTNDYCDSTIAHEILHLLGAEDFYEGAGERVQRAAMAQRICPNDIMYVNMADIHQQTFSDYNAYTVGWLKDLPKEYDCEEWRN